MGEFRPGGNRFGGNRSGGFGGRGGRPSFGGGNRGGFRGGDRGPVTMHKVICDECKRPCEVPFLPTAGKPVYCNTCFGGKKETGGNDRDNRGGDHFPRKNFDNYKTPAKVDFGNDINKVTGQEIKKLLESLNSKMDLLVKTLVSNNTKFAGTEVKSKEVKNEITDEVVKSVSETKTKKKAKKASKSK